MLRETSQLLSNVNPMTPNLSSAGRASEIRRMKKNAIRTRIPAASAVRTQRISWSGSRARSGRSREERPPVAMGCASAATLGADRAPVAAHGLRRALGLREQLGWELGVVELAEARLALAETVGQERAERLGVGLLHAGLADVLVHVHERLGRDRVRGRVGRVDRADAEVRRDLQALARRGGGLQR